MALQIPPCAKCGKTFLSGTLVGDEEWQCEECHPPKPEPWWSQIPQDPNAPPLKLADIQHFKESLKYMDAMQQVAERIMKGMQELEKMAYMQTYEVPIWTGDDWMNDFTVIVKRNPKEVV